MPWWPGRRRAPRRRAAILIPSLFRADATGNDAVAMCEVLRAEGWEARLFAENGDPSLGAHPAAAVRDFFAAGEAVALFHQSTQWEHGVQLFAAARGPRIVRDHNVTPPEFFAGISTEFARASEVGRRQRRRFARDPSVLLMAASETNAAELVGLGADPGRVVVVPPFHRAGELARLSPDEAALRRWAGGGPTALFVGRLAPNKGHRRALRVAAAYGELFGAPLHLRFVGPTDARWAPWLRVLEADRHRLGLDGVVEFVGSLTEAELAAAYLTAHVFLCCSEHEGFCVPLVEAAWLGVPVVATAQPAIRETLGRLSLVLPDASDDLIATAVRRVLVDGELREALVHAQRANVEQRFSFDRIRAAFLGALGRVDGVAAA